MVKNPPANAGEQEMQAWALGQEDALEECLATHCSILAGIIPWTEELGRLHGLRRLGHDGGTEHASMQSVIKKKKTLISGRQEGQSELEEDMITKTRSWRCARSGQCSGS